MKPTTQSVIKHFIKRNFSELMIITYSTSQKYDFKSVKLRGKWDFTLVSLLLTFPWIMGRQKKKEQGNHLGLQLL